MTKKILAVVVAVMMVMALSVVAFADVDVTADLALNGDGTVYSCAIPAGIDVSNGATVTLHVKGTSNNEAIRFYLTDASDNARVTACDVATGDGCVTVADGAFEGTIDLEIDTSGAIQGTAEPTTLIVKAQAWGVAFDNTTFEVVEFVGGDAAEEAPAETEAEAEAPAEAEEAPAETEAPAEAEAEAPAEAPAAEAPAETAKAPATGLALAVIPAVMALAAAAVSKKH